MGVSPSFAPPPRSIPPLRHPEEAERLRALHSLDILDTSADERFDRLTELAADVFGVRTALVSLVDVDRQWVKSACNHGTSETDRDASFCGHAILEEKLLVIEDTRADPRFASNPQVLGPPFTRFYAGAVLRNAYALPLGTLCLMDPSPRIFDRDARRRLIRFAAIVEQEIVHHTDVTQLRKLLERATRS